MPGGGLVRMKGGGGSPKILGSLRGGGHRKYANRYVRKSLAI